MAKTCAQCGKDLEWVGSGPEWMNSEQWDAVKAGDYFAKCDTPNHPNGNCYFWTRDEDGTVLARRETKVTVSVPAVPISPDGTSPTAA